VFEHMLIESAAMETPKNTRDQLVLIAKKIGADALAVVLDEIGGGGRVYLPSRANFFAELFRPVRQETVLRLKREQKLNGPEIARLLGISERTVDSDLSAMFGQTLRS